MPELDKALAEHRANRALMVKREKLAEKYQTSRSYRDLRDLQNVTHQILANKGR
jgi:hypothetical protein